MKNKYLFIGKPSQYSSCKRMAPSIEALNLSYWDKHDLYHGEASLFTSRGNDLVEISGSALKGYGLNVYLEEEL